MAGIKCECGGIWFDCDLEVESKLTGYAKPIDWTLEIEEDIPIVYKRNGTWDCCDCGEAVTNKEDIKILDKLLRGDAK